MRFSKHIGAIVRSSLLATSISIGLVTGSASIAKEAGKSPLDYLDELLTADWNNNNWVGNLLAHVDANLDPSLPLVDGGWTAALRHLAYDCWTREEGTTGEPKLRNYDDCGASAGRVHLRMHDVVWVLVRHEWAIYSASVGNQDRKVAAWALEQAISEYKNLVAGAEPRSVEPFSTTLKRLRIVRGYVDELAPLNDGEYLTDAERRQIVRDEINRQLALDGSGTALGLQYEPYLSIVGPLQELTRYTMQTYLSAAEAEQDAKSLASLVYGNGRGIANVHGDDLEGYLASVEADALSLSSLKAKPELSQLYAFVIEAIAARPNAIGISERYAKMKKRLLLRVTATDAEGKTKEIADAKADAQSLSAAEIKLNWPKELRADASAEDNLTLGHLWSGEGVMLYQDETGAAVYGSLDEACRMRAESYAPPPGRCAFKALADRVLRTADSGGPDPFKVNAREQSLLVLLNEISASEKAKGLHGIVDLIQHLMQQTRQNYAAPKDGELVEPVVSVDDNIFALPYNVRPNFLTASPVDPTVPIHAQSEFDRKLCEILASVDDESDAGGTPAIAGAEDGQQGDVSAFFANHCLIDPDAFDGGVRLPNLLYARFDRLLIGEPNSSFEAKISGLNYRLSKIEERLVEGDPDDGYSLIKPSSDEEKLVKDDTFIGRICDQSVALLPALEAAGLREVSLPPVGLDDAGLEVCR